MQTTYTPDDVTIRDVAPTPVAIMEHRGNPATIGATIQRFIAWRKDAGLSPKASPTFNVFHSDPRTMIPAEYRMDLCVGTDRPIEAHGERIGAGTIPGDAVQILAQRDGLLCIATLVAAVRMPSAPWQLLNMPRGSRDAFRMAF